MSQTSYQAALPHDVILRTNYFCPMMYSEASARLAHEPSRLGATRLLYPTIYTILYIIYMVLSMFFLDDEVAGGEFDGLVVAIDEMRCTGEF